MDLSTIETERLKFDLAADIHEPETIALRYGFADTAELKTWLLAHPWVITDSRRLKAILESDQGTADRVKIKSLYAVEESIPYLSDIIRNPGGDTGAKIAAYKELRQSGGLGIAKEGAGSGAQFSLTINLPSGAERITTEVVDNRPGIAPPDDC